MTFKTFRERRKSGHSLGLLPVNRTAEEERENTVCTEAVTTTDHETIRLNNCCLLIQLITFLQNVCGLAKYWGFPWLSTIPWSLSQPRFHYHLLVKEKMLTLHLGAAPCHQELNAANNNCGLAQLAVSRLCWCWHGDHRGSGPPGWEAFWGMSTRTVDWVGDGTRLSSLPVNTVRSGGIHYIHHYWVDLKLNETSA